MIELVKDLGQGTSWPHVVERFGKRRVKGVGLKRSLAAEPVEDEGGFGLGGGELAAESLGESLIDFREAKPGTRLR